MEAGLATLITDPEWFDCLSQIATGPPPLRLDEACFWHPRATHPAVRQTAGELAFLRLRAPHQKIAGYGFYASFFVAPDVFWVWREFKMRAGARSLGELARLLGRSERELHEPLGCTLLRGVTLWPDARWLLWDEATRGFRAQRGARVKAPEQVRLLLDAIAADGQSAPGDLRPAFELVKSDARIRTERDVVAREGQGTFKAIVLDAYGRQCAITGEHTEPVLEAAHIQPYLGPASNHVQNGILLTLEFHTLFDRGLVAIEPPTASSPDYRVRVSKRIRERWKNGHRYNDFDGRPLRHVPARADDRPSREALEWHLEERFEGVG